MMRHKGDNLLPVRCSKTTALQLVDDALTKRSLDTGRQIAEECLRRGFTLKRIEKMLICTMIFATIETDYPTPDVSPHVPLPELWDDAVNNLAPHHYDEAAGFMIRLADIYMERGQIERAWSALVTAEDYVTSDSSQLQYNASRELYEDLTREPRKGTVIDFRA